MPAGLGVCGHRVRVRGRCPQTAQEPPPWEARPAPRGVQSAEPQQVSPGMPAPEAPSLGSSEHRASPGRGPSWVSELDGLGVPCSGARLRSWGVGCAVQALPFSGRRLRVLGSPCDCGLRPVGVPHRGRGAVAGSCPPPLLPAGLQAFPQLLDAQELLSFEVFSEEEAPQVAVGSV